MLQSINCSEGVLQRKPLNELHRGDTVRVERDGESQNSPGRAVRERQQVRGRRAPLGPVNNAGIGSRVGIQVNREVD
mgnify:CR=1 FL=1